jgi:polysaccharide pyruvyl transferase WcaK-like protein
MTHSHRQDLTVIEDPAIPFVRSRYKTVRQKCKNGELACFLRELTQEYVVCDTNEEFDQYRASVEAALAENIKELCAATGLVPRFYSMHNFVVGNDDRDFAFRFTHEHFEKGTYTVDNRLTSIEKVAAAMNTAALNVCMRFHSVAFADTLEVPYVAIDYTRGGKVSAFMNGHGKQDRMAGINSLLESNGALLNAAGSVL